jgi:NitT/TauT family transport system substrate-binding protein
MREHIEAFRRVFTVGIAHVTRSRPLFSTALLGWLVLGLAACATSAANGASPQGPVTMRLAYFPYITHAAAIVGVQRGTFKAALATLRPNVSLEIKLFNAGPAEIEALLAGDVDIGYVGPNPAINGYVQSHGEALRIIAGAASGGAQLIVRPGAHIGVASDLAGKKLATPQQGGTQDIALRYYLKQRGLKTTEDGGNVQIVPTDNGTIFNLFKQGRIDGAWVPEPWASRLLLEGPGQLFVDEATLWPGGKFVTTNVVVAKAFLDRHPDVVAAFLTAHVDMVRYIAANGAVAEGIVNAEIGRLTGQVLSDATIRHAFPNVATTYDPLAATLFAAADHAFAVGLLGDSKPDVSSIYDLRPLNDVLAAKGLPLVSAS